VCVCICMSSPLRYGDADGLYLRGQWTLHRNAPTVNHAWRACSNLGPGLEKELQLKMAYLRQGGGEGESE